jgi:hypothetical protein
MLLPMLALLAWPTVSPAVVDAPTVPPWPDDTPAPVLVPKDGRCLDLKGIDLGPGIYMGERLAGIVNGRLEALGSFPARCQVRIQGAADMTAANCQTEMMRHLAEADHGVPMWTVVGVVTAALALGLFGGFGVGQLIR